MWLCAANIRGIESLETLVPTSGRRWLVVLPMLFAASAAGIAGDVSRVQAADSLIVSRMAVVNDGAGSGTIAAPEGATSATITAGGASLQYAETSIGGELKQIAVDAHLSGDQSFAQYQARVQMLVFQPVRIHGTVSVTGGAGGAAVITASAPGGSQYFWEGICPSFICPQNNHFDLTVHMGTFDLLVFVQDYLGEPDSNLDIRINATVEIGGALPALSILDAVELEGVPGSGNSLSFPVALSSPAPASGVTVSYGTSDITAQAGTDYEVTAGTLTFLAGESAKTIVVPVIGDLDIEPDETLAVTLSAPIGATIVKGTGIGTILNDDLVAVDFDWTMPDRFGLDADGNGLIDYFTTAEAISPVTWRVDFTYGVGGVCDPSHHLLIRIEGVLVALNDPALIFVDTSTCRAAYAFPSRPCTDCTLLRARAESASGPLGPVREPKATIGASLGAAAQCL